MNNMNCNIFNVCITYTQIVSLINLGGEEEKDRTKVSLMSSEAME